MSLEESCARGLLAIFGSEPRKDESVCLVPQCLYAGVVASHGDSQITGRLIFQLIAKRPPLDYADGTKLALRFSDLVR